MADGKKVLICASSVPFVSGGAELLVRGLGRVVGAAGYQVDTVLIPFVWDPPEQIFESVETWRRMKPDLSPAGRVDLVVATKFPSYAVVHPNKVAWVLHQHRGAYDLEGTIYDDLGRHPGAREYRERIRDLDREYLSECRSVLTISRTVSERMMKYCGIESRPLYHPPPFDGRYRSGEFSDDILVVGRLEPLKRVDLVINAMKEVCNPRAVLRIAGSGFLREPLLELTEKLGVSNRVRFEGFVSEEELLTLYAECGCVVYVPFEEDYGYAVLEAFKSRKPVIITDDSGGPLEFVSDGTNGRVVQAIPVHLAEAIDGLLADKAGARRLGEAGYEAVRDVSWQKVMDGLVEPYI